MAADRLWLAAKAALAAVQAGYAADGVPLPERQYVSAGLPAWDCDHLAVVAERVFSYSGNLAVESLDAENAAALQRGAVLAVWIIRTVPALDGDPIAGITIPAVADEEAAAELVLGDAERAFSALRNAQLAGELGGCNGVMFDSWQSMPNLGGLGGGVLRARVGLGG